MKLKLLGLSIATACALTSGLANAERISGTSGTAGTARATSSLSPAQRGAMAQQFVMKWGSYAQRMYGVDVRTWAKRMVPSFVGADAQNFRQSLQRTTFEGALATIDGSGHKLSDSRVIDALARGSMTNASAKAMPASLGELTRDLVYTQLAPCRLVDTRLASGAILAGTSRGFVGWTGPGGDFTAQGGAATDCGLGGESPEVLVVTVTAVAPPQAGYATLYPANLPSAPLAATLIYQAQQVNSTGASVTLGSFGGADFKLFSERTAQYVIDVVGYFDAPHATAVQCTETFVSENVAGNDIFDIAIPSCPTGYTITGAGCRTVGFKEADWAINGLYRQSAGNMLGYCSGSNLTSGTITVEGTAQCCRVPGR
jgi:hypothetical protein